MLQVTSDEASQRFEQTVLAFTPDTGDLNLTNKLVVDKSQFKQHILGWGGAFTDSAGINIASLSEDAQDLLLKAYFTSPGLDYTIARTNIGGCDFSPRAYTYCDTPFDVNLDTFALQEEDLVYKVSINIKHCSFNIK